MNNALMPGIQHLGAGAMGLFGFLVCGFFALLALAVLVGLAFLLVRYLLVATRSAQLYLQLNEPPTPVNPTPVNPTPAPSSIAPPTAAPSGAATTATTKVMPVAKATPATPKATPTKAPAKPRTPKTPPAV
jgi:predicted lipid-binding transport protein (Tim44 family)